MFDCRDISDTLHRVYDVWLTRVLDIQLLEVMYRQRIDAQTTEEARGSMQSNEVCHITLLNSLLDSIHMYIKRGHFPLKLDPNTLGDDKEFRIQTAKANRKAAETATLFGLYDQLALKSGADKDLLFEASQRYVDYIRSYRKLPPKKYMYHTFLPMNIFNDTTASIEDKQACGGCEKQFLSEELRQGHDGIKKCDVCLEVDQREPNIFLIDYLDGVANAAKEIQKEQFVSIVCQRHNLARSAPMDVMFIGTENCTVYVFDITTLAEAAFDNGLRDVLESERPVKLMFDCRDDSDTLDKMHNTWLAHVIDLQLLNVFQWRINPKNKYRHRDINSVHRLQGWKACMKWVPRYSLKCIPNFYPIGNIKDVGRNVWEQRPLDDRLVTYWGAGALNMFTLYDHLKPGIDLEMVSQASERYANYFRSYVVLPTDTMYIFHSYLPHNILTEADSSSVYMECSGCEKRFARKEFRRNIQKCRVCTLIEKKSVL